MNHNVSIIRSDMKCLGNKSDYKYAEQMKSHETLKTLEQTLETKGFLKALLWC